MNLNQYGTFTFHFYSNIKAGIPQIVHKYGKGTWSVDGKVVSFNTDNEKDIDEKHTLDFSDSKARFITKPSRDKTDRIIKTRLQFFESKIFWIERMKIFKIYKRITAIPPMKSPSQVPKNSKKGLNLNIKYRAIVHHIRKH